MKQQLRDIEWAKFKVDALRETERELGIIHSNLKVGPLEIDLMWHTKMFTRMGEAKPLPFGHVVFNIAIRVFKLALVKFVSIRWNPFVKPL